ncbi:calcium/sodium antiporter [Candidatus Woesearchaeota archaeon]|nr:calcium/sodium antiporter [Candidatus Woesearchaeota archaeon]
MNELFLWAGIFIISLAVLIKSSDYFTNAAEKIGLWLGIPTFFIGVSIVAIGTSLPELISSIIAVHNGSSEIVIGNVLGSNIANIFLIVGVAGLIAKKQLELSRNLLHVDLPFLVGTCFLLAIMIWDGVFTTGEGILLLITLVMYSFYLIKSREKPEKEVRKQLRGVKGELVDKTKKKKMKKGISLKTWFILFGSIIGIYLGARFTVESVITISQILEIGAEVIAVTAVALGTSLPELMVTISAAKKGKSEIAVGNVLGSNIFNILAVMGIPSMLGTLVIPPSMLTFSLPVMIMATLMFFFITQNKEITRWEGGILIIFYALFIAKIFNIF